MTERQTKEQRTERRERWVEEMGLRLRHRFKTEGSNFVEQVEVYGWDKGGDRKYDRDIVILIYDDGSFATSLDDGTINYESSKFVLNAMAVRADQAYHEAKEKEKAHADG